MPPTGEAYNVDWIFSNNSDIHVANHLDWFTTYHQFPTRLSGGFGPGQNAMGIGEVKLPVKTHPKKTGRDAHSTMELKDVLYVPDATCNILGLGPLGGGTAVFLRARQPSKIVNEETGAVLGLLDCTKLYSLRLSGQSPNQTSLQSDRGYAIRANWSDSERQRWKAHQQQLSMTQESDTINGSLESRVPPYTEEEKQWLKENNKDEFHFLRDYGYSIYDEEQRAQGRQLVRAFMKEKQDELRQAQQSNGSEQQVE